MQRKEFDAHYSQERWCKGISWSAQSSSAGHQHTWADGWNISPVVFLFGSLQLEEYLGKGLHWLLAVLTIITALQTTQAQLA